LGFGTVLALSGVATRSSEVDSGYYAAYSGLLARTQALDSAASNLSNSSTTGFRAEREYFRSAVVGPHALESQLNRTVNDFGVLGGSHLDFGQGALAPTGNPLDAAIEGEGFFAIQTKQGVRYTRDGSFTRAANGTLTTAHGEPVLNSAGKPIRLPTGEVSIGIDGVVSVAGATAGRIGVFTFLSSATLTPEGVNRYAAAPGDSPQLASSALHGGSLESSNQDTIRGSLQMIVVQRQAELMQRALSIFHTEFDKSASEDLPRA
jgi:flagellar basal-body rod protein FlgF